MIVRDDDIFNANRKAIHFNLCSSSRFRHIELLNNEINQARSLIGRKLCDVESQ